MVGVIDWSKRPIAKYTNLSWLPDDLEALYTNFNKALKQNENLPEQTNQLLLIFPYLIQHPNIKHWGNLLKDVVARSEVEEGEPVEGFKTFKVGDDYFIPRQKPVAPLPRKQSSRKRRPRERLSGNEIYEHYLALLMAQVFFHPTLFSLEKVDGLLYFARHVNTTFLYYKTYQALSYMYRLEGYHDKAVLMAGLAYNHWREAEGELETLEAGLSARALALAFEAQDDRDNYHIWLERSAKHLKSVHSA